MTSSRLRALVIPILAATRFISPGLRLTVDNWSSYVLVGIPVVNNYNGVQATPAWRTLVGVSAVFGP
jgi:hypothetical protein